MNSIEIFFNVSLIFVVLGLIGNVLMFVVFSKRRLRKLSISIYFQSIALVNLYITINWVKQYLIYVEDYYLINESAFLCKAINFTIFVAGPTSAWIQVAAGIDRFLITIVSPTSKFKLIQKRSFQIAIVAFIFIYNSAYYFHMLFDYNLIVTIENNSNNDSSDYSFYASCENNDDRTIYIMMDLLNNTLVPFIVMIGFTSATIYGVLKAHRRANNSVSLSSSEQAHRVRMRDIKFAVTMIVLNFVFLILNAPNPIIGIIIDYSYVDENNSDMFYRLRIWDLFSYYFYYMSVFYFQLAVNSLVRNQFFEILVTVWKFLFCRLRT